MRFIALLMILTITACSGASGGGDGAYSWVLPDGFTRTSSNFTTLLGAGTASYTSHVSYQSWQTVVGLQTAQADFASKISQNSPGLGVVIGFIDGGIDQNHSAFTNKYFSQKTYNSGSSTAYTHGTKVASVSTGNVVNGYVGVAPGAGIISFNIESSSGGESLSYNPDTLYNDVSAAISDNPALKVINGSFGSYSSSTNEKNDIQNIIANENIAFVFASGNYGSSATDVTQLMYPALYASNINKSSNAGIEIVATGISITGISSASQLYNSTTHNVYSPASATGAMWCESADFYCVTAAFDNYTGANSATISGYSSGLAGTSFATPTVSGGIAMLLSAFNGMSAKTAANYILDYATPIYDDTQDSGHSIRTVGQVATSGNISKVYGYGILNIDAALNGAISANIIVNHTVQIENTANITQSTNTNTSPLSVNSGHTIANTSIIASPAFGNVLSSMLTNIDATSPQGNFTVDLSSHAINADTSGLASNLFYQISEFIPNFSSTPNVKIGNLNLSGYVVSSKNQIENDNYSDMLRMAMGGNGTRLSNINAEYSGTEGFLQFTQNSRLAIKDGTNSEILSYTSLGNISHADNPFLVASMGMNGQMPSSANRATFGKNFAFFGISAKIAGNFISSSQNYGLGIINAANLGSNTLTSTTISFSSIDKSVAGFSLGQMDESSSFLGSMSSGALAITGSQTNFARFQGAVNLTGHHFLAGSFSEGISNPGVSPTSLFQGFSTIQSQAFTAGYIHDNFMGGKLFVTYAEPLRVIGGNANLNGTNISLIPTGVEKDYEVSFAKSGISKYFSAGLIYKHNVNNISAAPDVIGGLVRVNVRLGV